jgi:hypothetical protein
LDEVWRQPVRDALLKYLLRYRKEYMDDAEFDDVTTE